MAGLKKKSHFSFRAAVMMRYGYEAYKNYWNQFLYLAKKMIVLEFVEARVPTSTRIAKNSNAYPQRVSFFSYSAVT